MMYIGQQSITFQNHIKSTQSSTSCLFIFFIDWSGKQIVFSCKNSIHCILLCDERRGSVSLFSSDNSLSELNFWYFTLTTVEEALARARRNWASAGPVWSTSEAKWEFEIESNTLGASNSSNSPLPSTFENERMIKKRRINQIPESGHYRSLYVSDELLWEQYILGIFHESSVESVHPS